MFNWRSMQDTFPFYDAKYRVIFLETPSKAGKKTTTKRGKAQGKA